MKNYQLLALLLILLLSTFSFAFSPDEAITFVSKTNNYLLDNESAGILSPQVTITNSNEEFWVVVATNDSTPTVYIPVSNKTENIAEGEVTIRNIIETEIVITKITQLKNSSYGLSWPFSYSTRGTFDTLSTDLQNMTPKVQIVETKMAEIGTAESRKLELLADDTKTQISDLSSLSKQVAQIIDESRVLEEKYLLTPDTNTTSKYKEKFEEYFLLIDSYQAEYSLVESNLNKLKQGIAELQTDALTQADKDGLINYLKLPVTTGKLPSFFSQNNQTKTAIDSVFSASKNIEGLVQNLSTRKVRNTTWIMIYGANTKISKVNKSFYSLNEAAEAILSEDNAEFWADQDSVTALKTNWTQTKTRYTNQEYDKAQDFAKKAEKNVLDILEKGAIITEPTNGTDLIQQAIIVLIVIVIGLFVYETFIVKKRKKEEEENYDNTQ